MDVDSLIMDDLSALILFPISSVLIKIKLTFLNEL